ncbi:putative ubiquitin fusion degradation protein 1 [Paratrimastix pyriformis]|uniref:Ubiquitin fusion degradation protein 1 n=1 Tax=Paratrimastix pyriformis TaxID=342808 RepID=A0ABQ8UQW0_9EUKA|nr:putative ubiquitin fusion degradation protein 1 [Paratrimastix pyriformis]
MGFWFDGVWSTVVSLFSSFDDLISLGKPGFCGLCLTKFAAASDARADSQRPSASEFSGSFRVNSMAFAGFDKYNTGGKIILPASALTLLSDIAAASSGPMLFRIANPRNSLKTHCGVIEFNAEEGHCYLPGWMLRQLLLDEGQAVTISGVSLPKGKFVKFQPQDPAFLEISNPRAVLEYVLREYTAMTVGDILSISYNRRLYDIKVMDLRPAQAVSLFNTDVQVDFAPPPGMDENGQYIGAGAPRKPTPPATATAGRAVTPPPTSSTPPPAPAKAMVRTLGGQAKPVDAAEVAAFLGHSPSPPPAAAEKAPSPAPSTPSDFSWGAGVSLHGRAYVGPAKPAATATTTTPGAATPPAPAAGMPTPAPSASPAAAPQWGAGVSLTGRAYVAPAPEKRPAEGPTAPARAPNGALMFGSADFFAHLAPGRKLR